MSIYTVPMNNQVHQSDRQISPDPTIEKHRVSGLCLILIIKLKSEAVGILPSDPSVIPSPGNQTEINRSQPDLSSGWVLQDPIESSVGLMDLGHNKSPVPTTHSSKKMIENYQITINKPFAINSKLK
jgi:hypothetical protein